MNKVTDQDSIEIAEKKFGIQKCLDQIFDKEYVLGTDGEFEFKLKIVLMRFHQKSSDFVQLLIFLNPEGKPRYGHSWF